MARRRKRRERPWQPLQRGSLVPYTDAQITEQAINSGVTEEEIRRIAEIETTGVDVWLNDRYVVLVRALDGSVGAIHLSVRRQDRASIRDWRDLQRIKNDILGPECEAVELFPAESRLMDTANQYHLWGIADPEYRFPVGYQMGRVISSTEAAGSRQRPIEERIE